MSTSGWGGGARERCRSMVVTCHTILFICTGTYSSALFATVLAKVPLLTGECNVGSSSNLRSLYVCII